MVITNITFITTCTSISIMVITDITFITTCTSTSIMVITDITSITTCTSTSIMVIINYKLYTYAHNQYYQQLLHTSVCLMHILY